MNDNVHYTSTLNLNKVVICGPQIKHWVEFQLLDEQGEPLANMPCRAVNEAVCEGIMPEFIGQSDAEGVIRIEGLHPIPITLLIAADPLAEQLQTRRLRALRAEPDRPTIIHRVPLYGPQRTGFSPIERQAQGAGHLYHYLRIGQLCDRLPRRSSDLPLDDPKQPPAYHFPDRDFGGFTVSGDYLDRCHVLEVCPLRAWSLVLHHQQEYSLANAYNLAVMSILSYSNLPEEKPGSVNEFFERQCLDLSRTPAVWEGAMHCPCLVQDVPFNDRYTTVRPLDTAKADPPEGDTQLFYAISSAQVLVAWRGTEMNWPFPDLATDLTFRPVQTEVPAHCEPKVLCPDLTSQGRVHLGFRDAYEVARRIYAKDLGKTIPEVAIDRKLFICGHSLGGALGLIHAAALKDKNPLLYTYGMPRTFTLKAVKELEGVRHFRHVNDTDLIPSVPPEAELDNYLYNLYATLGFAWSLLQLTSSPLIKYDDAFCHHGEIAMFCRTEQHREERGSSYQAYRNKDGLGAPYHTKVAYLLPEKAKLYLVPHLSEEADRKAEQDQRCLFTSLDNESRTRLFPPHGNPKRGTLGGVLKHFMSQYQPYLYNQLLESIDPAREPLMDRQLGRQKFEQQMIENAMSIPKDELERNRVFLNLQSLLGNALEVTRQTQGGEEALQRFNAVADLKAYYEKVYG